MPCGQCGVLDVSSELDHVDINVALEGSVVAGMDAFARTHGLTQATVLLGCYALVLGRFGGLDDIVIGNVSSGRTHPVDGIEEALGLFIETLPVHYSLSSDACFADWLAAHQVAQSGHGMHGHIGLGAIQGLVGLSGQALFDAVFVYENYPVDIDDDVTMGGLSFTGVDGYDDTHYPIG